MQNVFSLLSYVHAKYVYLHTALQWSHMSIVAITEKSAIWSTVHANIEKWKLHITDPLWAPV